MKARVVDSDAGADQLQGSRLKEAMAAACEQGDDCAGATERDPRCQLNGTASLQHRAEHQQEDDQRRSAPNRWC